MSSKAAAPPTRKRLFRLWRAPVAWLLGAALAGGLASCVTTQEGPQASAEETAPRETSGAALAAADSSVRAVQLYAGEDERRLPVLALGTGERLTLEFDLMAQQGRPLSVYFYHAGRTWKRDPAPARFLDGFRSDDLLDYTSARARGVPYVHYTYRFPEEGDVGFEASGNYILRVTEQGREDDVLFERPFFVTEEAGAMELHLDELRRGTQPGLAVRPTVRYRIPAELGRSSFNFAACFVPDERLRRGRCVERPESSGPRRKLTFELPYRESFAPGTESFFLDLSRLSPGGGIAGVNRDRTPYRVRLETDHADFAEAGRPPLVGGQPVVRGAGIAAAEPALSAEYASVRFRFVPRGAQAARTGRAGRQRSRRSPRRRPPPGVELRRGVLRRARLAQAGPLRVPLRLPRPGPAPHALAEPPAGATPLRGLRLLPRRRARLRPAPPGAPVAGRVRGRPKHASRRHGAPHRHERCTGPT